MTEQKKLEARATLLRGPMAAASKPVVAFIPGGPGLSSRTLVGAQHLTRSFDVALIDPPGTGGLPEVGSATFDSFVDAISAEIVKLGRPVIVAGHSFGGYYALACVARGLFPVHGLALMSTPLTPESYAAASKQYDLHKDANLAAAEKRWEADRSEAAFRAWVASYGVLYFTAAFQDKGREMLLQDRTSPQSCLGLMDLMSDREFTSSLLASARRYSGPKLFIAGEDDLLYPMESLKKDAESVPMDFVPVPKAGHFPTLENPEAVARAFEKKFGVRETLEVP